MIKVASLFSEYRKKRKWTDASKEQVIILIGHVLRQFKLFSENHGSIIDSDVERVGNKSFKKTSSLKIPILEMEDLSKSSKS